MALFYCTSPVLILVLVHSSTHFSTVPLDSGDRRRDGSSAFTVLRFYGSVSSTHHSSFVVTAKPIGQPIVNRQVLRCMKLVTTVVGLAHSSCMQMSFNTLLLSKYHSSKQMTMYYSVCISAMHQFLKLDCDGFLRE